ncbi:MAG: FAD-dependent oxidoreductase [Bacteroidota bacterium]
MSEGSRNERIETVVIGAGQAGLSASSLLAGRGLEHVVLERGKVGESWRSQRWDGFYLNTPNWTFQLPGFAYDGPDPDAFASRLEVIDHLERYARSFGAPLREETPVERVRRNGRGFAVETPRGTIEARNVVVAAGAYQKPTPTAMSRGVPADILQIHTSGYRRPSQLPEGSVLIVGSGQSGCQVAEELLAAGRRVVLSVSRCTWIPRRYRGRDMMRWMADAGMWEQTPDALPSLDARLACNPPVSGNDGGHDCNPRTLARQGAVLIGRLEGIEGTTLQLGRGLAESLAAGDEFVATFKRTADALARAARLDLPDPEPEETVAPVRDIPTFDLRDQRVTSIVWANGFRPDHSWIEGVATDALGWPVQTRGAAPVPGLYFVGLHWLTKRKSALFLGVGEDAAHVAQHLEGASRRA